MDKGVIMQMNMNEVLKTAREWIAAAALSNLTHQDTCLSKRRVLSTLSIQPKMDTRFFSKHKRSRQSEFYTDFKQLCYIQIDQLIRSLSLVIGMWQQFQTKKFFKLGGEIWVHTYLHTMLSRPKKLYQTQNWYGTEDLYLSKDLILAT